MKTKEELNALKQELEKMNGKLEELTDEELGQVTGGIAKRVSGWSISVLNEEAKAAD